MPRVTLLRIALVAGWYVAYWLFWALVITVLGKHCAFFLLVGMPAIPVACYLWGRFRD